MIRRPPRSTPLYSSAASDVYKRQPLYGPMPAKPYAAPAMPGLAVRQNPVSPRSQFSQKPQAILNGRQTQSPTLTRSTALPISTTVPRFSCPKILPGSILVRPSYICRSEPQIFVVVIFTSTSVAFSILASGTVLTTTSRGPLYTTAVLMIPP